MGAGDDGGATQIKKTIKCWGRGRKKGDIGVGAFCPGWWLHPGQKVQPAPTWLAHPFVLDSYLYNICPR